jgi:uncharacterized cofD-like protein
MEKKPEKSAARRAPHRTSPPWQPDRRKNSRLPRAGLVAGGFLVGVGVSFSILFLIWSGTDPRPSAQILWISGLLAVVIGAVLLAASALGIQEGARRYNRSLVQAQSTDHKMEPKVVAIGGGTGLSTLLRGMKYVTCDLTAVVTVADDGGSSGRLRRTLGIPPPGDLRNCLAAMAEDESMLTQLFQYRFAEGDGIHGHAFGNLFVSALAGVTGNFERGLIEAGRVLSIRGRVFPSTLSNVTLEGELIGERTNALRRVSGESRIAEEPGAIWRVWIEPEDVRAYPGAVQAILNAAMIVLGPGSLFTSVLPNLLIPEIREALEASRALKVYVCNITTQPGETDGFTLRDHLEAIGRHIKPLPFQVVLANNTRPRELPEGLQWVELDSPEGAVRVFPQDLADEHQPGHHDPKKLADALAGLLAGVPGHPKT